MLIILILTLLIVISLIALLISNINRIKELRYYGIKLEKKNAYYALLVKIFIKDLPN